MPDPRDGWTIDERNLARRIDRILRKQNLRLHFDGRVFQVRHLATGKVVGWHASMWDIAERLEMDDEDERPRGSYKTYLASDPPD